MEAVRDIIVWSLSYYHYKGSGKVNVPLEMGLEPLSGDTKKPCVMSHPDLFPVLSAASYGRSSTSRTLTASVGKRR